MDGAGHPPPLSRGNDNRPASHTRYDLQVAHNRRVRLPRRQGWDNVSCLSHGQCPHTLRVTLKGVHALRTASIPQHRGKAEEGKGHTHMHSLTEHWLSWWPGTHHAHSQPRTNTRMHTNLAVSHRPQLDGAVGAARHQLRAQSQEPETQHRARVALQGLQAREVHNRPHPDCVVT